MRFSLFFKILESYFAKGFFLWTVFLIFAPLNSDLIKIVSTLFKIDKNLVYKVLLNTKLIWNFEWAYSADWTDSTLLLAGSFLLIFNNWEIRSVLVFSFSSELSACNSVLTLWSKVLKAIEK